MAFDFKTRQIRVNKIINSGGTATAPLLIYGVSAATDQEGGVNVATTFPGLGSDVWLYVSGAKQTADTAYGAVAFRGDVVVSGAFQIGEASAAPSTPASGKGVIYARTGSLYFKNSSGTETSISSGGSGGSGAPADASYVVTSPTSSLSNARTLTAGSSISIAVGGGGGNVTISARATGSDTQVQFNDGGTNFGANANFTFDKTSNTLSVTTASSDIVKTKIVQGVAGVDNAVIFMKGGTSFSVPTYGSDVTIFVSGSKNTGSKSVFNTRLVASGNISVYSTSSDTELVLLRATDGFISGAGDLTTAGNAFVNGGNLQTTATTFNLFPDASTTTVNFATQANTLSIGSFNSTSSFNGDVRAYTTELVRNLNITGSINGGSTGNLRINSAGNTVISSSINTTITGSGFFIASGSDLIFDASSGFFYVKKAGTTSLQINATNATNPNIVASQNNSTLLLSGTNVTIQSDNITRLKRSGQDLLTFDSSSFDGFISSVINADNANNLYMRAQDKYVVISGTLGNRLLTSTQVTGSVAASLGFTGSLTKLGDGSNYLVAGTNITLVTGSNGNVTISSTGGASVAGSNSQVQFNDGGVFGAKSTFAFATGSDRLSVTHVSASTITASYISPSSPLTIRPQGNLTEAGSDAFLFVSGNDSTDFAVFGGRIVSSGSMRFKNALAAETVIITSTGGISGSAALQVGGTLTVAGVSTLAGDVTASGNLNVNGGSISSTSPTLTIKPTTGNLTLSGSSVTLGAQTNQINLSFVNIQRGVISGDPGGITFGSSAGQSLIVSGSNSFTLKHGVSGIDVQQDGASYATINSGSAGSLSSNAVLFNASAGKGIRVGSNTTSIISGSSTYLQAGAGGITMQRDGTSFVVFESPTSTQASLTAAPGVTTGNVFQNATTINVGGLSSTSSFSGDVSVGTRTIIGTMIGRMVNSGSSSGVTNFDMSSQAVFFQKAPAGNITANFTNVPSTSERVTSPKIIVSQSSPAYIVDAVRVGGTTATINWTNAAPPTGTANRYDVFDFNLVRSGSTWIALGQMTSYGS